MHKIHIQGPNELTESIFIKVSLSQSLPIRNLKNSSLMDSSFYRYLLLKFFTITVTRVENVHKQLGLICREYNEIQEYKALFLIRVMRFCCYKDFSFLSCLGIKFIYFFLKCAPLKCAYCFDTFSVGFPILLKFPMSAKKPGWAELNSDVIGSIQLTQNWVCLGIFCYFHSETLFRGHSDLVYVIPLSLGRTSFLVKACYLQIATTSCGDRDSCFCQDLRV